MSCPWGAVQCGLRHLITGLLAFLAYKLLLGDSREISANLCYEVSKVKPCRAARVPSSAACDLLLMPFCGQWPVNALNPWLCSKTTVSGFVFLPLCGLHSFYAKKILKQ